jgi:hypothetical protein
MPKRGERSGEAQNNPPLAKRHRRPGDPIPGRASGAWRSARAGLASSREPVERAAATEETKN